MITAQSGSFWYFEKVAFLFIFTPMSFRNLCVLITVLAVNNEEILFCRIGFYFMQGWTVTTDGRFCLKILSCDQGSGNENKNPFSDQSNVADFYLWILLPADNPESAET